MYYVFYRERLSPDHSADWKAARNGYATKAEADAFCKYLLSLKRSAGQQEYSHAISRRVKLSTNGH